MRVFISLILLAFLATACGGTRDPNAGQDIDDRRRAELGSIFGTQGMLGSGGDGGGGAPGIAVNSYLWRASLDTISFFPMAQVDAFGGVIITEWYSMPEAPNERYKLDVYILGRELRADGVRVAAFRQVRGADGEWRDAPVADDTAAKLENAILTRARQMRIETRAQVGE
ncbi:MAG: DUF3576 domain-containing protein [Marivibrio sp.]|uniref:DUF3576 domain-containing protein n=1 Tax=Marivibrio sp. TaxID=2039719 RepID=UPI0032F08239